MKKFAVTLGSLFAMGLAGCSNSSYTFSEAPKGGGGNGGQQTPNPSCASHLTTLTVPAKFLFIVDMSGSNVSGDFGGPPTDPDKSVRGGALQTFLNTYGAKTNFSWGFMTFNDNSATPLIGGASPMFSMASAMQTAINTFGGMTDVGNTPYSTALQTAAQALSNDSGMTNNTKYMVVFISDGMPNPMSSTSTLLNEVRSIVNASPNQVTFNTVYYGDTNQTAHDLMASMAAEGRGYFYDTNVGGSGRDFNIGNIIQIPGVDCGR